MLRLFSQSRGQDADNVASVEAAEAFCRSLPADDPIASQRAICDALMSIKGPRGPEIDRLRALLVLNRQSQRLLENLLSGYASPEGSGSERETRFRQPIVALSRSFAQAYEYFYRHVREHPGETEWIAHAPSILVSLLMYWEIDLLLALFRYEKLARGRWKDINGLYAFALAQGLERRSADASASATLHLSRSSSSPASRVDSGLPSIPTMWGPSPATRATSASITVEQAFIRILLLQLTDGGQLLPFEIASARHWVGRWCTLPSLVSATDDNVADASSIGFRIDLSGSHGLKRASSLHSIEGHHLRFDISALGPAIEEALATMRNGAVGSASEAIASARQVVLLARLKVLFAAERPRVRRRGERTKVESMSVRAVIGGLPSIGRILRNETRRTAGAERAEAPRVDEITIGDVSDYPIPGRGVTRDVAGGFLPVVGIDGLEQQWQVQDRSESGCLLRGQTLDTEQSLPGSLLALREPNAPWTVAVVRRLNKVGGSLVELGVEYVGRNPQRVVMLTGDSDQKRGKFVALYLPECSAHPRIPIKTLIVPAHEYDPARILTIVSTSNETPICLKEPIEHQRDFVWASFDLMGPERKR